MVDDSSCTFNENVLINIRKKVCVCLWIGIKNVLINIRKKVCVCLWIGIKLKMF